MFRFRLQRVLELREEREQAKARELMNAEGEANVARSEHDRLQQLHSASRAQLSSAHQAEPTVGHLHHLGFILNALDERLNQAAEVVQEAEGVVSQARTSLDDAARDRRVMDRLKDKHADAHRGVESHRDRLQMDEIALGRFTRQREVQRREVADAHGNTTGHQRTGSVSTDGVKE
jgi:flagellar FliJ protein